MAQVVLVLLTVIAVAAAAAMAPGRLRTWAGRRRPLAPKAPRRRPSRPTFLAVCASCLEMVETPEERGRCPTCGGELAVRRRIHSARAKTPAAR
jgi:uncharacterized paraquat-inducible protein A